MSSRSVESISRQPKCASRATTAEKKTRPKTGRLAAPWRHSKAGAPLMAWSDGFEPGQLRSDCNLMRLCLRVLVEALGIGWRH